MAKKGKGKNKNKKGKKPSRNVAGPPSDADDASFTTAREGYTRDVLRANIANYIRTITDEPTRPIASEDDEPPSSIAAADSYTSADPGPASPLPNANGHRTKWYGFDEEQIKQEARSLLSALGCPDDSMKSEIEGFGDFVSHRLMGEALLDFIAIEGERNAPKLSFDPPRKDSAHLPNVNSQQQDRTYIATIKCAICGAPSQRLCRGCRNITYCSSYCQYSDKSEHSCLCWSYPAQQRPSPDHVKALLFPEARPPQLVWVKKKFCQKYGRDQLEGLDELLGAEGEIQVPIHTILINRNARRDRKLDTTLKIVIRANNEMDASRRNLSCTLGAKPTGCHIFKGPMLAVRRANTPGSTDEYPRYQDIRMVCFRNLLDYFLVYQNASFSEPVTSPIYNNASRVAVEDAVWYV